MVVTAAPLPDAAQALSTVGLTVNDVRTLGGSVLDAGRPFLVGSLAAGLGNRGSDVDIHLLVPDLDQPTPPFLLFAGATPVDIEHYPEQLPAKVLARARSAAVVDIPLGRVSLAPPPDRSLRRRLARWLSAVPLIESMDRIYDAAEAATILPVLIRAAIDEFVQLSAVAGLAERIDGEAAAYLWSRAGRQLLEVRCRAAGDVATGHKWLPDRATRLGIPVGRQRQHYGARSAAEVAVLAADTGLADVDPWHVTQVRPDPRSMTITIGRQQMHVTPHQRVLRTVLDAQGPTHELIAANDPVDVLNGLLHGHLLLTVDGQVMGEVLAGAR
jgi:hypothetical protein